MSRFVYASVDGHLDYSPSVWKQFHISILDWILFLLKTSISYSVETFFVHLRGFLWPSCSERRKERSLFISYLEVYVFWPPSGGMKSCPEFYLPTFSSPSARTFVLEPPSLASGWGGNSVPPLLCWASFLSQTHSDFCGAVQKWRWGQRSCLHKALVGGGSQTQVIGPFVLS